MRRLLLGLLIGVLAFGAGAVGAKVVNVTNPMSSDLNSNGYRIINQSDILGVAGQALEMNGNGDVSVLSAPGQSVAVGPGGAGGPSVSLLGGGDVFISPGRTGYVRVQRLPNTDPHYFGALWLDGDTLKVSAG